MPSLLGAWALCWLVAYNVELFRLFLAVCVCVCARAPMCESHPGCYGYRVSIVKIQHFCFQSHKFARVAAYDVITGVSVISKVTIELGLSVTFQSNLFGCHGNEIS